MTDEIRWGLNGKSSWRIEDLDRYDQILSDEIRNHECRIRRGFVMVFREVPRKFDKGNGNPHRIPVMGAAVIPVDLVKEKFL